MTKKTVSDIAYDSDAGVRCVYMTEMSKLPRLPPELWEHILARAGSLDWAPHVGACARQCAVRRIQTRVREFLAAVRFTWVHGATVRFQYFASQSGETRPWVHGTLCRIDDGFWAVQTRRATFVFLPHPRVRLRLMRTKRSRTTDGLVARGG